MAALVPAPVAASGQGAVALLRAAATGVKPVEASQSLVVDAFVTPAGTPATKGQILVTFDTASLQQQLDSQQKNLREIQQERRNPSTSDVTWATREIDATRELLELQSSLAAAAVRAPSDGYVVRNRVNLGGKAKRRKPVVDFVEFSATRLTATLVPEPSPAFAPGEIVAVAQPGGGKRFRARVDTVDRSSGSGAALALTPLELPYLMLDVAETVALERQVSADSAATVAASGSVRPRERAAGPTTPDGALSERIDIEVVNVDVIAFDGRGSRVTDLAREDFELELDGKPAPIEFFSAPIRSPSQAVPSGSGIDSSVASTQPPGRFLVFVDATAIDGRSSQDLLEQIEALLLERESHGDEVHIAAFTNVLRVLHPGSSKASGVGEALAELGRIGGRGDLLHQERLQLEEDVRSFGRNRSSGQPGSRADALEDQIRRFEDEEVLRQRRMVGALRQWVQSFSGAEGRKSLLLVTSGLSANPGAYLFDLLGVVERAATGPTSRGVQAGVNANRQLVDDVERLLQTLQDARFVVYTVTPPDSPVAATSAENQSLGAEVSRVAPRDRSGGDSALNLARFADETGGASFVIDRTLGKNLEGVVADTSASYSLGFSTGPGDGYGEHRIRVRVRRPGVSVRSRTAFRRLDPAEQRADALVAAASLDVVQPSFALELVTGAPIAGAKKGAPRRIPVQVRIPISALSIVSAPSGASYEVKLEVRFAVARANGELHLGEVSPVTIAIPQAELERARESYWTHASELEIGAGGARIGVLVVDLATGEWATAAGTLADP
ncbi:MAG: VWA domain-containing protein [Thermoanaerobaculia bacterium]